MAEISWQLLPPDEAVQFDYGYYGALLTESRRHGHDIQVWHDTEKAKDDPIFGPPYRGRVVGMYGGCERCGYAIWTAKRADLAGTYAHAGALQTCRGKKDAH